MKTIKVSDKIHEALVKVRDKLRFKGLSEAVEYLFWRDYMRNR